VKTFCEEGRLVAHRLHWNENISVKQGSHIWTQSTTFTPINDKALEMWIIWGLSRKYPAILNVSRTGHVTL
jgi:hypothetical protein